MNESLKALFLVGLLMWVPSLKCPTSAGSSHNNGNVAIFAKGIAAGIVIAGLIYAAYRLVNNNVSNEIYGSPNSNNNQYSHNNHHNSDNVQVTIHNNRLTILQGHARDHGVPQEITLTGTKKKIDFPSKIEDITIPGTVAHVTVVPNNQHTYIECDEAVHNSGLTFHVESGVLKLSLPDSLSKGIAFIVTQNQPLINIFVHLCNNTLKVRSAAHVIIKTPLLSSLSVTAASTASTCGTIVMKTLQSIDVSGASQLTLTTYLYID